MPLPIRDGNQSLTTLSTLIVNSAHVPAHTVVSLGSQAITDIAQAVSGVELGPNSISALEHISVTISAGTSITIGNVVSVTGGLTNAELRASSVTIGGSVQVSNLPATQAVTFGNIAGSVTAVISGTPSVTFTQASVTFGQAVVSASNIGDILSSVGTDNTADATTKFFKIGGHQSGSNQTSHIVHVSAGGSMSVDASGSSVTFTQASVTFSSITGSVSVLNLPATQTVTFTQASVTFGTPVVTGSVSVLNFPSTQTVAGTVTAYAVGKYAVGGPVFQDKNIATDVNGQTLINATVNAKSVFSYDGESHIFAKLTPNTTVTIGSLPAISGAVTANANLFTTVTVQTITGGQNGSGILFLDNVGLYDVTFAAPGEYTIQSGFISGGFVATGVTLPLTNAFGTPVTGSYHSGSLFRRQVPYSNLNTAFRITAVTTGMTPASFTATVRAISDPYYGLNRPISGTVTANTNFEAEIGGPSQPNNGVQISFYDSSQSEFKAVADSTPLPISGTVTANVLGFDPYNGIYPQIPVYSAQDGFQPLDKVIPASIGNELGVINISNPLPISGTVTVGNSVTIGSLPAISGTVTVANQQTLISYSGMITATASPVILARGEYSSTGWTTLEGLFTDLRDNGVGVPIGLPSGVTSLGVNVGNSVTIGSLPAISGTVTANAGSGTFNVSDRGTTGVATVTSITATTSVTLMASNSSRKVLTIYNEGAGNLHVLYGSGTATTANYSVKLFSGDYLEIDKYTGQVNAIFATAGTARVTEIT